MENLIQTSTNRILNNMTDRAVREAIKLERQARDAGDRKVANTLREGVRALARVLWELFGGLPIDNINAIRELVDEHEGETYLGCDSRNYVRLFQKALERK